MEDYRGELPDQNRKISPATVKMITIIVLIFLLMIPTGLISGLINERSGRRMEAVDEISSKWGNAQMLCGPFITLPYKVLHRDTNAKGEPRTYYTHHKAHFLPNELNISGEVKPMTLSRGIYEAVVYNSTLNLTGAFKKFDLEKLGVNPQTVEWDKASLEIGISEMRGVTRRVSGEFNKVALNMDPCLSSLDVFQTGISSPIEANASQDNYTFSFAIDINGSYALQFIPLGQTTSVHLKSDWSSPSFFGAFLPSKRKVDPGFTASWNILDLNRDYPQAWTDRSYTVNSSSFGVKFINTADAYQQSERALKYAILFILITFVGFFLVEVITKVRIHPIQYALVGMAIVIFYLLLVSVSEHIAFGGAYLASCIAVMILVTGYSSSVLKSRKFALIVGGVYAVLYGYLFILLQLEDYSLVSGVAGLAVLLGLTMYLTRNIDWYAVEL
ncbi:cell envelope integrity protein CreD [Desulfatibacillum aliphaticivorans]|uniref:cell envelope integrity protein CreD n=1 Tax=Desulfatibacillum aliphaticivorans TaxID=218208 RepID=UPI0003F5A513|nr:cell envelope integrity protein CreD [Desulfatibacillum aliphaticivorans]